MVPHSSIYFATLAFIAFAQIALSNAVSVMALSQLPWLQSLAANCELPNWVRDMYSHSSCGDRADGRSVVTTLRPGCSRDQWFAPEVYSVLHFTCHLRVDGW